MLPDDRDVLPILVTILRAGQPFLRASSTCSVFLVGVVHRRYLLHRSAVEPCLHHGVVGLIEKAY